MTPLWWQRARALGARRGWPQLLVVLATLLSLALLLWGAGTYWPQLRAYQWRLHWPYVLASALAFSLSTLLAIAGWAGIMRALKSPTTWRQDAKFFFYSWLNRRLPTPLPYIASRVLLYEGIGVPRRLTSLGLLWENVLVVSAGALLMVVLLPFTPGVAGHIQQGPAFAAALGVAVILVLRPYLVHRCVNWLLLRRNRPPMAAFLGQPATGLLLLVYVAIWFSGGFMLYLLVGAIYPVVPDVFALVVQAWVVSGLVAYLAFLAPAGLGVREVALASILSLALPLPVAIAAALLARLWTIVNELAWALVVWRL